MPRRSPLSSRDIAGHNVVFHDRRSAHLDNRRRYDSSDGQPSINVEEGAATASHRHDK